MYLNREYLGLKVPPIWAKYTVVRYMDTSGSGLDQWMVLRN